MPDNTQATEEVFSPDNCDLCGKRLDDDEFKDHGERCRKCPPEHPGADPMDLWPPETCLAHMEPEPCQTCRDYIAAGL